MKISKFLLAIAATGVLIGCSASINDSNNAETGALSINGEITRSVFTENISKAKISVICDDITDSITKTVTVSNGKVSSTTIEGIPVGNNRIVKVEALDSSDTANDNYTLMAVTDIDSGTNTISIDWQSTAIAEVYYTMWQIKGASISSAYDDDDLAAITDKIEDIYNYSGSYTLINTTKLGKNYYNNKVDDDSSVYVIDAGSISFTYTNSSYSSVTVKCDDPDSETTTVSTGTASTLTNVTPGTWNFYLISGSTTLVTKSVTVTSDSTTALGELGSSGSGSGSGTSTGSYSGSVYINLATPSWSVSENGTYTTITTTKSKDSSGTVSIKFTTDDSDNSTGLIKLDLSDVSADASVYISGTAASSIGGLKIQSNASDAVNVYLTDATISSTNYPCIEVTKGSPTNVVLSGTNKLTDGRSYGTGYGEEYSTTSGDTYEDEDDDGNTVTYDCTVSKSVVSEGSDSKGTLYSKGDLTLSGSGSLTVTESYKNCIASKGFLTVNGGTYTLTSNAKNGFDALYGFTQNDGDITFTGNGGISASTSSASTSYYVHKTNGIAVDGIISSTDNGWIKINGGSFTCTAAYSKGMNAKWSSSEDTDTDGTTGTPDPSVYISGGTISITVTGTGWTGDNTNGKTYYYYDADGVSCHENIKAAAEGIESASKINISGGTVEVTATDDGLNESLTGGSITISGGSLYCYASGGDAVDCNGNIYVTGGTVAAFAPTGSEDGLDAGDGYSVTITGGLVASCSGSSNASASSSGTYLISSGSSGSSGGMGFGPGNSGSSSSGFSLSSGSTITIYNSSSTLIFTFTMPTTSSSSYSSIIFASPNFTYSGTYTAYTGSTVTGGTNFHGLYTTLPTVSSTGTSTSVTASTSASSSSGFNR